MKKPLNYIVKWISPNGFANEGDYVYGSRDTVNNDPYVRYLLDGNDVNSVVVTVGEYESLEKAKAGALRRMHRAANAGRGWGEANHRHVREADEQGGCAPSWFWDFCNDSKREAGQ